MPDFRDARRLPNLRPEANIAYSTKVITSILHAAGAQNVLTIHHYSHLIGVARMGFSPPSNVVDANQQAWAVSNLLLADGSVCPTQGSANPALTIMAMSSRFADRMASGAAMGDHPAARTGHNAVAASHHAAR